MSKAGQMSRLGQYDSTKQREEQVLALVRQGLGNEAIAQAVCRSERYVKKTKIMLRHEGRL